MCNQKIAVAKADLSKSQQGLNRKQVYLANGISKDEQVLLRKAFF
jgi:hypothetical protein